MWELIEQLKLVGKALEKNDLTYALCGGLAVGTYTEPRGTIDIDIVVDPEQLDKVIKTLSDIGFEKMSEAMPLDKGKMMIQRLLKFDKDEPHVLQIDLCMPDKEKYPEVWKDWTRSPFDEVEIPVLSRKGLIEMKKSRRSEKDIADIKALEPENDEE